MQQMIRCPNCGTMMPAGARFCGICAHPLPQPDAAPDSSPTAKSWRVEKQEHLSSSSTIPKADTLAEAPSPPSALPKGVSQEPRLPPVAPAPSTRQRNPASKIAWIIVALIVVVGAVGAGLYYFAQSHTSSHPGNNPANTTNCAPSTPTVPQASPLSAPPPFAFNSPAAADLDCLHIQTEALECPNQLVLKQPQRTYDSAALQQMRSYISAFAQATGYAAITFPDENHGQFFVLKPQIARQLPPIPDMLEWVPGGSLCLGQLDFINTGTESIQIKSIGFTYDSAAIDNSFAYRLVDICSVLGVKVGDSCGYQLGSGGGCDYNTKVALQGGAAGTQVTLPIANGGDDSTCPLPLTLDPTQPVVQTVKVYVTSALAQELYRVKLTVTITTAQGTKVLALPPSFTSVLAFSSASQFSCAQLQGNAFTQEPLTSHTGYDPTLDSFPCV